MHRREREARTQGGTIQGCAECASEPWFNTPPVDLARDPDHDWQITVGSQREAAVAHCLNLAFPGLALRRPPGPGLGDFVGLDGRGPHFDLKALHRADEALVENIRATLNGPYNPFIVLDAEAIPNAEQRREQIALLGLLLRQNGVATNRIIVWPNVLRTRELPPDIMEPAAGPPEVGGLGDLFGPVE